MRTTQQWIKKSVFALQAAGVFFLATSCSSDDNTNPDVIDGEAPVITISGENTITAKRGEVFEVSFQLTAENGAKEIQVSRGGGHLETVTLAENPTTYTYNTQTVPDTAEEGEEISYSFVLVDNNNKTSIPADLIVSTQVYDEITIGGQVVYHADIASDGIVPSGTNVKFSSGRSYYIPNSLEFGAGTSLTIEDNVYVYMNGESESPIEINVDNQASVTIEGTVTAPVIFTSSKTLSGNAAAGDWNRLRIGDVQNSTLRYVRSEYAGSGFRFAGSDSSNTFEYLSTFNTSGEGFYITNGNANFKYLAAISPAGGGFRLGDAYSGKIQFAISQIDQTFSENQEVDIRETASPILANVTLIGPGTEADNTHGVRLRGNSAGKVYSAIVADFPRRAVRLNDNVIATDLNGATVFAYSYVFNIGSQAFRDDTNNGNPFIGYTNDNGYQNPFFNNITALDGSNPVLTPIDGIGTGSFIPSTAVQAANNFNPGTVDPFFTPVTFVGAVENSSNDWTRGWVKNPNGSVR